MAEEMPDVSDFPELPPLENPGADFPDLPGGGGDLGGLLSIEFPAASSEQLQAAIAAFPDFPSHPPALDVSNFPELSEVVGGEPSMAEPGAMPTVAQRFAAATSEFPDFPTQPPLSDEGMADMFPDAGPGLGPQGEPAWPQAQGQGPGGGDFPDLAEGRQEAGGGGIMDMLQGIYQAVTGGGQQQKAGGFGPSPDVAGPIQWPWPVDGGAVGPEGMEDYSPAAPSMNVTSLHGARGAGGWGFGSRGMGNSLGDQLEPGRRRMEG